MRTPKEKTTPPGRKVPDCYCVTDAQGTMLYRIETMQPSPNPLQLHHFRALSHFLETTERIDRLQAILTQWHIHNLNESFGVWEHEQEDLGDFGQLLQFLAECHGRPTVTELENMLGQ